ncbi:Conserved_hypothetical protein [Hexamita inflata]|uniref:Capsid protein n=1 Tax=Hexamita inflata TaxID=28002 RepID=A0AA86TQ86_9EUKA|nr:Conserved hypothetical protein [Hexamita inflata]
MAGVNMQFLISTGESILSQNQSYLSYTVQFGLKVMFPYNQGGKTPADNIGRYFVQNRDGFGPYWYFERYVWNLATVSWVSAGKKPIAFMAFACNSAAIIDRTEFSYKNLNNEDRQVSRYTAFAQQQYQNEFQNNHNQSWFQGDKPCLEFIALPYKYATPGDRRTKTYMDIADLSYFDDKSIPATELIKGAKPTNAADSQVTFLFNKTFTIPLNILNQVLDADIVFPLNVLGGTEIKLNFYLLKDYIYRVFGQEDYLDSKLTGIIALELVTVTKDSTSVKAELNDKDGFSHVYKRYEYTQLPTDNTYAQTNRVIYSGHISTADICIGLCINDTNQKDSLYLKQRYTMFTAEQQMNIINGVYDMNEEYNWFRYFNLWKGSRSNQVFSKNLENITSFKCEMLRGLNLYNQYSEGVQYYDSFLKIMMNYALLTMNLESFSIDTNQDVVGDGMNTFNQKIMLDYQIGLFTNGNIGQVYNPLTQTPKTLISDQTPVAVELIQKYDSSIQFDTKKQTIIQDDDYLKSRQQ